MDTPKSNSSLLIALFVGVALATISILCVLAAKALLRKGLPYVCLQGTPSCRSSKVVMVRTSVRQARDEEVAMDGLFSPTHALPAPGPDASMAMRRDYLEHQLDSLTGKEISPGLRVVGGHSNRLHGGQSTVQVVEDTCTHVRYAIKFFVSTSAFEKERGLYTDARQPLGRFLPQLHSVAERPEELLKDAHGEVLPPCIIMEKGDALDAWVQNCCEGPDSGVDQVTGIQILTHIAERLKDLHAAGYVHRDIKPGNVMWLPRKRRWTIIDFGCAARTGSFAPTGFTLHYAPPEALQAYRMGERGLVATEALDAWSLGILAIELLSGQPMFEFMESKQEVTDMITGLLPAPWENERTAPSKLRKLGIFRPGILSLLQRDPIQRVSVSDFHTACTNCLQASITTHNDGGAFPHSSTIRSATHPSEWLLPGGLPPFHLTSSE